jgi:hypothetical protein
MTELREAKNQELLQEIQNRIERQTSQQKEDKIVSLKVQENKLFAQLDDGRELSIPID